MIIRAARAQDLDAIDAIQRASPEASQWAPANYLQYSCLIAEDDDIVGFIVTRETAAGEYEILNLAVSPGARRRGIGQTLLQYILQTRPATWFLEVRESNFAALQLYEKQGFVALSKRVSYYPDSRESAIVMRLQR